MRTNKVVALAVVAAVGVACSEPPPQQTDDSVVLEITKVEPGAIFIEGGDLITVETKNGCPVAQMTGKVKELAITLNEVSANKYTFTAPAIATTTRTDETITLTCSGKSNEGKGYKTGTATATLTYDPALCPAPTVKSYSPVGDRISVLAKMQVTFSVDMDPQSITRANVFIQGVDGEVAYQASTRTATFTAKEQLKYNEPYTAVVKSGGVVGLCQGKALKTTLSPSGGTPDPSQDSWTFTTRKEGEGNPWVGDISAAAGISTGGNYKLFSVTGQPTPVGTAEGGNYKLQSGFIYATQPPQQ